MKKNFFINKSIKIIFINNFWSIIKGPLTIYILLKTLTPEQQGIWYTFISLSTLSVFAEMGFTNIITRFVSHEYAHLSFNNDMVVGDEHYLIRLISLIRYAIKFYLLIIPLAIIILIIAGICFFKNNNFILFAWVFYSISSGLGLFVSLLQSIYQGLNKVYETQQNIFFGSIFTTCLMWLLLYLKFNIFALIISNFLGIIFMLTLLISKVPKFWYQIYITSIKQKIGWFNDIITLQFKYAISWVSGYLIFNLYVPVVYKYYGAEIAGKLGITLTISRIISNMSNTWINSELPKFNILVAQKNYSELNKIFNNAKINGNFFYIISSLGFIFFIYLMQKFNISYYNRFLDINLIILILIYECCSLQISFMANYLRSFKDEPYYIFSFTYGIMILLMVFFVLPHYNLNLLFVSTNLLNWLIALPWAFKIYYSFIKNNF